MLLYVAGPYSADTEEGIQANIQRASDVSAALWDKGHAVICPHMNTGNFHNVLPHLTHQQWLDGDFQMIAVCDGIVFLPGWENSKGSRMEKEYAEQLGIPCWFDLPELPDLHVTEVQSPIQVKAFRETLGKLYRTHLQKNADYSPVNVLGPGWTGIVVRVWDKVVRLMNLTGFKIIVGATSRLQKIKYKLQGVHNVMTVEDILIQSINEPKFESIEDTLLDLSVYGIIGKLLRDGKWGR